MQLWLPLVLMGQTVRSPDQSNIRIRKYYDQEKTLVMEEYFLKDSTSGIIHGSYRQFFLDGSIATSITYVENQPEGKASYYYENGNPKMIGSFSKGKTAGLWEYYFESGQLHMSGDLIDDVRQGEWSFYFENGTLKSRGHFINNQRDGIWNFFYEDGGLKAQALYEDGKGPYKEFYGSGSLKMEGENVQGKSEGPWVFYYESGDKEAEGSFENGLKTGLWRYYHKNGATEGVGYYKSGKKDGRWTYYHEDGQVSSEGQINEDVKDGFWQLFYESGKVKGEVTYIDGTGTYSEYYENGRLKQQGEMTSTGRQGKWEYFNDAGKLEGQAEFTDDFGTYTGYYENGDKKMEGAISGEKRVGDWRLYNPDGSYAGSYKPIYEEEDPIFYTEATINSLSKPSYDKPAYRFKSNSLKYFRERINEYRGLILSIDVSTIPVGKLGGGVEYYYQERLGYEVQAYWIRDPFFRSHEDLALNVSSTTGWQAKFRQKLYSDDGNIGMFYFGHEVSYSQLKHTAQVIDSTFVPDLQLPINLQEQRFQYGVFIGNRWMRNVSDAGLTIDTYIGIGLGWRWFDEDYSPNAEFDLVFGDIDRDRNYIPIIFGVTIGIVGRKSRGIGF
ncbi:MAG: toxin-antitoxin system YwqK family antitoxin [Bacteroidota bacterium]